jgi:hypothetical protein
MSTKFNWRTPFESDRVPFRDTNNAHLEEALNSARNQNEILGNMLAEAFGRIKRLEKLARHGRQGVPLGPVTDNPHVED